MRLAVDGIGMVSKLGTAREVEGWLMRDHISTDLLSTDCSLPLDFPDECTVAHQLIRRMSHFARMSMLSAWFALRDSGRDITGKPVGIIQGSVYGPIISGIQAFDELIDFGDNQLSPTNFSGSVFNTAATYLSLAFGVQGPTLSHTSGMDTLYNSLLTAWQWLKSGEVEYVIVGVGDEFTTYFEQGHAMMQSASLLPTCEGWTTFIVSNVNNRPESKYRCIDFSSPKKLPEIRQAKIIYSIWHQQIQVPVFIDHAECNEACFPAQLRGFYPAGSAFDLALALVCAQNKKFPASCGMTTEYQIRDISRAEQVYCCSQAENDAVYWYDIGE